MRVYEVAIIHEDATQTTQRKLSVIIKGLLEKESPAFLNVNEQNEALFKKLCQTPAYVEVAGFEVLSPQNCIVNIETIKTSENPKFETQKSQELPKTPESILNENDETSVHFDDHEETAEEKSIENTVLEENSSTKFFLLNKSSYEIMAIPSSGDLFRIYDKPNNRIGMSVNLNELKADGVIFYVDTEFEEEETKAGETLAGCSSAVPDDNANNNEEADQTFLTALTTSFSDRDQTLENNSTAGEIDEKGNRNNISLLQNEDEANIAPKLDNDNNNEGIVENQQDQVEESVNVNISTINNDSENTRNEEEFNVKSDYNILPPVEVQIFVKDNLRVTLSLKSSIGNSELEKLVAQGESSQSTLTSPGIDSGSGFLKFSNLSNKKAPLIGTPIEKRRRDSKDEIFQKLVRERLFAIGGRFMDASSISDLWSNGYIQHRALSLRVPNVRNLTTEEEESYDSSVSGSRSSMTNSPGIFASVSGIVSTFAGSRLQLQSPRPSTSSATWPPTRAVMQSCINPLAQSLDTTAGILNSACCTIIEADYFILLPHLNLGEAQAPEFKCKEKFMENWIDVLYMAAYQIDPLTPKANKELVENELNPLRDAFVELSQKCKTISKEMAKLHLSYEKFRFRLIEKLRENTNWPEELIKRRLRGSFKTNHIQMTRFQPSDLFENYLFVSGRSDYGLYIKHRQKDPFWKAFSGLQNLEKRVIFMSLVDHAKITIEALSTTLGHMKELYTPGYPTNVSNKLDSLYAPHSTDYESLASLPIGQKLLLKSKINAVLESFDRFGDVYDTLTSKIHRGKKKIKHMTFDPRKTIEFIKSKSIDISGTHIIVPFTALAIQQIAPSETENGQLVL